MLVEHQRMDIDRVERHILHEVDTLHHHPRHPEEDNVEGGDEYRSRVMLFQLVSFFRPAQGRKRPQRGREPCVENILVLHQQRRRVMLVTAHVIDLFERITFLCVFRDGELGRLFFAFGHITMAVRPVPRRNAMAPPELARDAPRLDIVHPLIVGLGPVFGDEFRLAGLHRLDRRFRERLRIHIPLVGEHGFDDDAGAVAERLHDLLVFDLNHQAFGVDIGDDALPRLEAIQPAIFVRHEIDAVHIRRIGLAALLHQLLRFRRFLGVGRAVVAHGAFHVHEPIHGNVVALGDLIVVEVMTAGDLHRAGAEIRVRIVVSDDRDEAPVFLRPHGNFAELANDRRVTLVRRMHRHGAVAKHRFGARRRDGNVIAGFAQHDIPILILLDIFVGFAAGQRIFEMPHMAVDFPVLHFEIGNRGFEFRVPVDEALVAIDEAFIVKVHKDLHHRLHHLVVGRAVLAHGEALTRPVAGGAEAFQLVDDRAARLMAPFPDFLDKRLAADIGAFRLLPLHHLALDHHLRRDARMVGSRLPQH